MIFVDEMGRSSSFTFGELAHATNRMADALTRKGWRRGVRLLIQLPNSPEFPILFLGAMKAGIIPIPVSALLTAHEVAFIRKDSGAKAVFQDKDAVNRLLKDLSIRFKTRMTSAEEAAFWLYTSGTEGEPKGVIHAHRSIPAHDARSREWMGLKPNDVVFNTSALNWSYALTAGCLDVWRRGATAVVAAGRPKPKLLERIVSQNGVTVLMSVPGIYRRLVEAIEKREIDPKGLSGVRECLSAGEALPQDIRDRFLKATGITVREGLGMTEHSVYLVQPRGQRAVKNSCGRALPGQRIAILREDRSLCKPGEVGVLASHRSCEGLMKGYYQRPKEQRRAFRGDWFLSGDLAYRDSCGNFFYVGRRDDVITAGGYRISPMEVENVLNRHPSVKESAVVGRQIEAGKTIVSAFIILKKGKKNSESQTNSILSFASENLAPYKAPREIEFVEDLPKTNNGKLIRRKFRSA